MTGRVQILVVLQTVVLVGCSEAWYFGPTESSPGDHWQVPSAQPSYVYPPDPPMANADVLVDLLSAYARQHRVVVVDFWSMSSDASRARFAPLTDLHQSNRVSGLQCVAVAFDSPGIWSSEVAPFLRSVGCSYPCVMVPASARGEVVARLGYEWNGTIPAALVFDRAGRLAAELIGDTPAERIRQIVGEVLAGRHEPIAASRRPAAGQVTARARALEVGAGKTVARSASQWGSLDDVDAMADAIARRCEATINWADAKVAVLPFTLIGGGSRPEAGKALADAVARILSARHPQAVVNRSEADAIMARHKLTPLGVEYDSTALHGKADWTHIITGTLRSR